MRSSSHFTNRRNTAASGSLARWIYSMPQRSIAMSKLKLTDLKTNDKLSQEMNVVRDKSGNVTTKLGFC